MRKEMKEKMYKGAIIIGLIATILSSCAVTFNNVWHSSNVKIDSEQNATQHNDSTQFRGEINTNN